MGKYHPTEAGVPQGGIISPLLSNIYLHELDNYMDTEIIPKVKEGGVEAGKREYSKERRAASYQVEKYTKQMESEEEPSQETKKRQEKARIELRKHPSRKTLGEKAYYVRYADDWVIGVYGRKTTARSILEKVRDFLGAKLHLQLNTEKTKITGMKSEWARYLGVDISRNTRKEKMEVAVTRVRDSKRSKYKMKVGGIKVKMQLPFKKILGDLTERGFMKKYQTGTGKLVPTAITK